jgi:alkyl hydroperoxide reductase subunit AhpF
MGLISETDQQTIRNHFDENLTGDVEIVMFTESPSPIIIPGKQECETCEQTQELLEEVAALSDKLSVSVHEISSAKEEAASFGIDRVPAFVVKGASRGRMRFFGIPAGYGFSGFLADLVDASKGATDLSDETREFLASVTEGVNIKVFTTPT